MQQNPFRIEDFITQRINEMNEFYQQLNLDSPMQQNLEILQSFSQPSNQSSIQYKHSIQGVSKERQTSPPFQETIKETPEQYQQVRRINFDDVPVKGRGRKFEDILEEQLASQSLTIGTNDESQKPLMYLKKKSRKFLSHANKRPSDDQNLTKDKSCENSQRIDSLDNISGRSLRNSPKQSSPPQRITIQKMNTLNLSPHVTSPQNGSEKIKEQKFQIDRQKNLSQQLKQKQKKIELQQNTIKIEREKLDQDIQKFNSEKLHLIEEEKKKFRKEMKLQEKHLKAQMDIQYQKQKDEISELKSQLKANKDQISSSEHNQNNQILKLKQQNDSFLAQRDTQESTSKIQIQQLHDQVQLYQLLIKDLQEENLQLLESQSTQPPQEQKKKAEQTKPVRLPVSSSKEKQLSQTQESLMSRSAKVIRSSPDVCIKLTLPDLTNQTITASDLGTKIDEQQFNFDQNPRYKQYLKEREVKSIVLQRQTDPDGRVSIVYKNGKKEVIFSSGIHKEIFKDGYTVVNFKNKDLKQVFPNGTVVYYFQDANATQTTLLNGQNIYKFYNKQIEIHHPSGLKEIKYQNGIIKVIEIS